MTRCPSGPEGADLRFRREAFPPETMGTGSGTEVSSLTMDGRRSWGRGDEEGRDQSARVLSVHCGLPCAL